MQILGLNPIQFLALVWGPDLLNYYSEYRGLGVAKQALLVMSARVQAGKSLVKVITELTSDSHILGLCLGLSGFVFLNFIHLSCSSTVHLAGGQNAYNELTRMILLQSSSKLQSRKGSRIYRE